MGLVLTSSGYALDASGGNVTPCAGIAGAECERWLVDPDANTTGSNQTNPLDGTSTIAPQATPVIVGERADVCD